MQHELHHPRGTLGAHIRQIHIPSLVPSRQSSYDTVCPLAHFRRQISAVLRRDMLHQSVRTNMRRATLSLRCAEQTAVGIPWSEGAGWVFIWRVAPRAEREPIADAVREFDALQEFVVWVGGVEVARAAL